MIFSDMKKSCFLLLSFNCSTKEELIIKYFNGRNFRVKNFCESKMFELDLCVHVAKEIADSMVHIAGITQRCMEDLQIWHKFDHMYSD